MIMVRQVKAFIRSSDSHQNLLSVRQIRKTGMHLPSPIEVDDLTVIGWKGVCFTFVADHTLE